MRRLARGALGTFISLGVSLLVAEAAVRLYLTRHTIYDIEMTKYANVLKVDSPNPKIGHVHRPNSEARLMNVDVRINSDGFRGVERPTPRKAARRIVFLGDSLTLGWGVEEHDTFASLLETRLNAGSPTEIMNFGTGNYNTEQEVNLFLERGDRFNPDQVVLFYFINDAEITPKTSWLWFVGYSRCITFYWSHFQTFRSRFSAGKGFQSYYAELYRDDQPGWQSAQTAFLELRAVCARRGIRLQVVLLPELHNLEPYPFKTEYGLVQAFLTKNGIENLDLTPRFEGYKQPMRLWVAQDDAHPNELAHRMIAENAFDFLK